MKLSNGKYKKAFLRLPSSVSGFTLLEILVTGTLIAALSVVVFSFILYTNRFVNAQAARIRAEQDLNILLANVRRDVYESSGYYYPTGAVGPPPPGTNVGYPPVPLLQNIFPSPLLVATGGTYTEENAPCSGLVIFKDYPLQPGPPPIPLQPITPMAISYQTTCVHSGTNVPYSITPAMQTGLQAPSSAGSGGGINCNGTAGETPQVTMQQWLTPGPICPVPRPFPRLTR